MKKEITKEKFETIEKVVSLLKEGFFNILHDYNIKRWDDNTIGAKDSGCIGFPLCGSHVGYKLTFSRDNDIKEKIKCPFTDKSKLDGIGCWWDCQLEKMGKQERLNTIISKIDELEEWLYHYKEIGGYYKYNLRGDGKPIKKK